MCQEIQILNHKLYNVDLHEGLTRVLGFRQSGKLLMKTKGGDVVSYHHESKRVEKLGLRGFDG